MRPNSRIRGLRAENTFLAIAVIAIATSGFFFHAQSDDPDRALYDDDVTFQKLSSGAQARLTMKFGPKSNPAEVEFAQFQAAAPELPAAAVPTNVLVNDPAADTTARDTQSETTIVLGSGSTVVAGFNDSGSFLPGGNQFTGYSVSIDGGSTFLDKGPLPFSPNGDAGDPVLARNTSGTIFFTTLTFFGSGMQCFRSFDDGQTFSAPVNCAPGTFGLQDKPWVTVDTFSGSGQGNIYLTWRDFGPGNGIKFTRSTDGGDTYTPSGGILLAGAGAFNVQGPYVTVGPDHAVYVFWLDQSAGFGTANIIRMRKSTDNGVSFASTVTVKALVTTGVNGDLSLNGGFRSNSFPQAIVNPADASQLYLVYNDCSGAPCSSAADHGNIFLTRSTDGGSTWSASVQVNDDVTNHDQYMPAISITPAGRNLFVGFYDRRSDPTNSLIERWAALGSIGSGGDVTFQPNQMISSTSFPVAIGQDPVVNPVYMGDYDTVVADSSGFYITWGDNRNPHPPFHAHQPDVFFTKVNVCTPPVISGALAAPDTLWPPNRKFVKVTIDYNVRSPCPSVCTLSVTSNEPSPDEWQVVDDHHVLLRAERNGNGNGRIYTITVTCTGPGGSSTKSVTVFVPHDQGH